MLSVLLVDDEPDHRDLFGHLLTAAGHRVLTAPDAGTALTLADTHRIDAAVLDVRLPRSAASNCARRCAPGRRQPRCRS